MAGTNAMIKILTKTFLQISRYAMAPSFAKTWRQMLKPKSTTKLQWAARRDQGLVTKTRPMSPTKLLKTLSRIRRYGTWILQNWRKCSIDLAVMNTNRTWRRFLWSLLPVPQLCHRLLQFCPSMSCLEMLWVITNDLSLGINRLWKVICNSHFCAE